MQFRWAAAIALWSMLSGPIIGPPAPAAPKHAPAVTRVVPAPAPAAHRATR